MIHQLTSDLTSFKPLSFGPGLNVILADKSPGASDLQSRNGAGKTSFVELIHFLFGADARPSSIFRSADLRDWTFTVSVDIGDTTCSVSRSGRTPSRIRVDADLREPLTGRNGGSRTVQRELSLGLDQPMISNEQWKDVLGARWFGLPQDGDERFQPTFRSLFSFWARRQEGGGFQHPTQHTAMQQLWDRQVSISYALGLDWTIPCRFQELRGQDKIAKDLRRAARSGDLGRYFGKAAELRTKLTVMEHRADGLRTQLEAFRVVPQYRELEREASDITGRINALNTENIVDLDLLRELRSSLQEEGPPNYRDLNKLYREAGIVLPGLSRRRIEEVARFHDTIVENRRSHLADEVEAAERRLAERDQRKEELDQRRRQIMEVLKSGGALEHYTRLREELGRAEAEVEMLRQRLTVAERLDSTRTELEMERTRLVKALRNDIHERDRIVRDAILTFEDLSQSLYERAGSLTISDTPNGPHFEVHIAGERSRGITNMQIFCFDLMLTETGARRGRGPGFLIHDSHLFDGVDERQVAKALQLGAARAAAGGFQYIVTLNSDAVPQDGFTDGFDLRDYCVATRLTDATETGGLFGFRFN